MVWPTLGSRTAKEQNRTGVSALHSVLTLLVGHLACKTAPIIFGVTLVSE